MELKNISKQFENHQAVNDISFSVKKGEVVAILGANGAGKTTTIRMMLGLLKPTSGTVSLFQQNPQKKEVRSKIGCMLQDVSVMDGLKARELVELVSAYYPKPLSISHLFKLTGLNEKEWNKRTEKLSGGQKRRMNFALALAGDPDLLFFDEPTVGMDITSRERFWDTIQELKRKGKTIIFTTHYLQEADDIADRILMIHKGRLVGDGAPEELKEKLTKQRISFQTDGNMSVEAFYQFPTVLDVQTYGERITLITSNSDHLLKNLFEEQVYMEHIEVKQGKLEEVFTQLMEDGKETIDK